MVQKDDPRCTGCSACQAICPDGAISMAHDREGFICPEVDMALCTGCDRCSSVCPINGARKHPFQDYCYAAANADASRLAHSASGGVFPVLADYALQQGGFVCGCVLDAQFTARHCVTSDARMIKEMSKSKYVQSAMDDCFVRIKELLLSGTFVLFTGTSCQVAGLHNFLGRDFNNLLTMDFVCHGVPSPAFFKLYAESLTKADPRIAKVYFRDKRFGWKKSVRMTQLDADGTLLASKPACEDLFMASFVRNYCLGKFCASCQYTTPQRVADLTVGDFWGIWDHLPALDDDKGLSLLLVNTEKGAGIIDKQKNCFRLLRRIPFKSAAYNIGFYRAQPPHPKRALFFDQLSHKESFMGWLRNELFPVGIYTFPGVNNYGSLLVGYALSKTIEKLGYKAEIINIYANTRKDSEFEKFRKKFLERSTPVYTYEQCTLLNNKYQTIITGSDQVWHDFHCPAEVGMLAWAHGKKTLISYAASFGEPYLAGNIKEDAAALMLQRFDAISVREDTGVALCKKLGVKAKHLVDPTLLLTREEYEELINSSTIEDIKEKYIASYLLINNEHTNNIWKIIQKKKEKKIIDLSITPTTELSAYQWLNYIKNASLVITDSFHGVAFSILFKKQFLIFNNKHGLSRIPSLLGMLGIEKQLHDFHNFDAQVLDNEPPTDYQNIDDRLELLRNEAIEFLKNSLSIPPTEKPEFIQMLLFDSKVVRYSENSEDIVVDKQKLYAWAEEVPFDPSLKTVGKSPFRLAAERMLGSINYDYETTDKSVLQKRKLAYELLLADAHRILDEQSFSIIEKEPSYKNNPHALHAFIRQTVRDRHQKYLYEAIERLRGKPVYYYGCGEMYKLKRIMFSGLKPQCILIDNHKPLSSVVDGLPVCNTHEFLPRSPVLPIIIFSGKASTITKRLNNLYPAFDDIVACAIL